MKKDVCGVYKIENKINGKMYIGSSKHIYQRWQYHRNSLNKGTHHNKHLQLAWNKYGEDNFKFDIIEECDLNDRYILEKQYIDKYNVCRNGYNIMNNTLLTDYDIIEFKMSDSLKGKKRLVKYDEETIKRIIYLLFDTSLTYNDIAKMAKVDRSLVCNIVEKKIKCCEHLYKDIVFPKRKRNFCKNKLTEDDVNEIILRLINCESENIIAKDYNVNPTTICSIHNHRAWNYLTKDIIFPNYAEIKKDRPMKINKKQAQEIYDYYIIGFHPSVLAEKYGVSTTTIYDIFAGRTWT